MGIFISQITHAIIKLTSNRRPVDFPDDFHHKQGGGGSPTANATKLKERQEGPPAGHEIGPPDGMT